jgi:hypothetical protein
MCCSKKDSVLWEYIPVLNLYAAGNMTSDALKAKLQELKGEMHKYKIIM